VKEEADMGIGGVMGNIGVAYDIIAEDKTGPGTSSAVKNLAMVTAAFAAVGAAGLMIQKATDRMDKLSEKSSRTAYSLGATTKEMSDLTIQTSSAHHQVDEVSASFDLLARTGVKLEDLRPTFEQFGEMGEALGMTADTVIADVVPAMNAFHLSIKDVGDYQDVFTHVMRNTTLDLGTFSSTVIRLSKSLDTLGLGIYDIAALFEVFAKHGIQARAATSLFNEVVTEQEKHVTDLATATQEYADAQERVNELLHKSSDITRDYNERVMFAGRDVKEIRNLTFDYTRNMRDQNEETKKAEKIVTDKKTALTTAATPFDIYAAGGALAKAGITPDEVAARKELIQSNKGVTDAMATEVGKYVTSSAQMQNSIDKLTLAAGDLLMPLQTIAGPLGMLGMGGAAISGLGTLGSLLGLGGGGAAAGAGLGGAALAGAGVAGVGLGAAGVYGLEKAGLLGLTGPGMIRSAGAAVGGAVSGAGRDFRISIDKMIVSKDYPADQALADMNRWLDTQRRQAGVRSI
jgi:hypothetical protein